MGRIGLCLGALGSLLVMVLELVGAGDGCRGRARQVGWVVSQLGCRVGTGDLLSPGRYMWPDLDKALWPLG